MFTASDGRTYHEVSLAPQEKVGCPCGGVMYRWAAMKPTDDGIYTYECPSCGEKGEVHGKWSNEHWPEKVKEELKTLHEKWAKTPGLPVVEEKIGMTVFNILGIDIQI